MVIARYSTGKDDEALCDSAGDEYTYSYSRNVTSNNSGGDDDNSGDSGPVGDVFGYTEAEDEEDEEEDSGGSSASASASDDSGLKPRVSMLTPNLPMGGATPRLPTLAISVR